MTTPVSSPETLPTPHTPIEESTPALLGLRRFVLATRLAWRTETREDREAHDIVIKAAPERATTNLGFSSKAESPSTVPINISERLNNYYRRRQARKLHHLHGVTWDLTEAYGKKQNTKPSDADLAGMTNNQKKWATMHAKYSDNSKDKTFELGSDEHKVRLFGGPGDMAGPPVRPERMRGYRRKDEMKAGADYKVAHKKAHKIEAKMEKGTKGHTMRGRRRATVIARDRQRETNLEARLVELRRLTAVRNSQRRR